MGVAHDTAGAREIGNTEAEKDRRVRGQIDRRESEVCVIEHGASLFMDSPCVRAPRHDEEAGAVFVGLVEATSVPQVSIAKGCNFRVGEHVTDSGKSAHVEVDTDEVKIVPRQHGGGTRGMLLHHVSWRLCCGKRLSKMRTAEESATEGRRSQPRTTRAASLHVSLHNGSTWLERVFVERDGKIVAISASVELARVVRNVVAGFLENTACEDLCGSPARWAWVPLELREMVLVVHEVTGKVGEANVKGRLGGAKTCHGKHKRRPLGKGFIPCRQRHGCVCVVPAFAVLAAGVCGSLGGGRNEVEWLWLNKGDCPGWRERKAWRSQGHPQWAVKGDVPDKSVPIGGLRDREVEFPASQFSGHKGFPTNRGDGERASDQ